MYSFSSLFSCHLNRPCVSFISSIHREIFLLYCLRGRTVFQLKYTSPLSTCNFYVASRYRYLFSHSKLISFIILFHLSLYLAWIILRPIYLVLILALSFHRKVIIRNHSSTHHSLLLVFFTCFFT